MRTSTLFGAKSIGIFEIYGRPHGQGGRESSFSWFCADVLYGRPLTSNINSTATYKRFQTENLFCNTYLFEGKYTNGLMKNTQLFCAIPFLLKNWFRHFWKKKHIILIKSVKVH